MTEAATPPPAPGDAASAAGRAVPGWRRGLRNGLLLGALVVAAAAALNAQELPGLGRVAAELPAAVAVAAAVHLPQILLTALAWRALLPAGPGRPGVGAMAALRWYREAANALLPAGALVGQAAAARLLARRGVPGDLAGATATVDLTLEAVSQLFFTLAGVALLLAGRGTGGLLGAAAAGLGVALAGAAAMVLVQRRLPVALIERAMARFPRRLRAVRPADALRAFQAAVLRLHADPPRLAAALLLHTVAWVLGAVEVAVVLGLLGHPVAFAEALVVESLAQALRNVGFMLPGALAVQEGAFIGAAALVGVPPGAALAAALARRAREVAFALPGLLAWQRAELGAMRAAGKPGDGPP